MSNQNWDILSCIVLLIISASSCLAEIDLEINQANIGTIPIAIETRHSDDSPLAKQIATIMREDLAYSEKIEVAKNPKYAEFIVRVYSDKNAEQQAKTNQSFCMQMEYPMRKSDQVAPKQFCLTGDPKTQIRLIAHQFSDKAHWHITGKSNIFTHRIGFVRETMGKGSKNRYQIVVSDFDQHGEQVLLESPNPIMSLVFSPDGKKLAYVSFEEDIARIFIQDLLTGRREVISQFSGVNSAPSWSPDGSKIAMALSFSGITKIYIMDLATKKLDKITSGMSIDTEPYWVKDGSRLVFSSNRSGSPQVHEYSFSTQKVSQLTHHGQYNVAPQMTSDGRYIIFLSKIDKKLQIVAQDNQSQQLHYLGNGNFDDTPRISPTNDLILYTTANGTRTMLAIVSIDGTIKVPMPADKVSLKHPSWSPVSRWQ